MDLLSQELEKFANRWGIEVRGKLATELNNNKSKGELLRSLRFKTRKRFGELAALSFSFRRHGVFLEKGVGKETPIELVGTTNRIAHPWFNHVIQAHIYRLDEEIALVYDQAISDNIYID